jgi:glycosyltransferase involved in cell wall biosynthesis
MDLQHRVTFLGRLPARELHDCIRAAALVVVPSRWYENQPMIVLEAFGCGRPVVASDLGGLSEMVESGLTGQLVPHNDPIALASALIELSSDPERCHAMGAVARERAASKYTVVKHLGALDGLYAQAQARALARR